jgi:thiamine pyrophosphokinase
MTGTALLICNGEPPTKRLARKLASRAHLVVAADGGANIARRYGIRPDVIIGDFDSIRPSTLRHFAATEVIRLTRQDNTDMEKALDYLEAHGFRTIQIIGATGNRIDHTLGNLSVVWRYDPRLRIEFVGDGWRALPVRSGEKITAKRKTTVSLIPFGRCTGITLKGLHYPLHDVSMTIGDIGVSNVVEKSPFIIRVRSGKMLVFLMGDR